MTKLYKIIFDDGKPYEEEAENDDELRAKLKKFYVERNEEFSQSDVTILIYSEIMKEYNDITNSEFIDEVISDIIREVEFDELVSIRQRRVE